ncbi:elongation factor G [Sphaerobacter sp.]|uniref:elongation factor G n=1 Tax=Sphaerobacter sp. TaxID=2099654 RepID=UPI001DB60917|nr:elongation factor G [Sphaerobacter sp.]MBX5444291.1 elongation factor G [Sphaerobacter sp.]
MKTYTVDSIRNVGLFSHGGAGKTSLTEAMAFLTHATTRLGRVEEGNTISDWDPDEIKRGISISTSLVPVEWRDHKINLLDAPGYADFVGEIRGAMRVADLALILLDASAGVEVGTEQVWDTAATTGLPRALVINKMDRENANFENSLSAAQTTFGSAVVPVQLPIGAEKSFTGFIDLLSRQAYQFGDGKDGSVTPIDIPADLADAVETHRTTLVERICENDEELMMRYLEDDEISVDELRQGLKAGIADGSIVPVFVTAATALKGVTFLLDAIVDCFPSPNGAVANDATGNEVSLSPDPDGPLAALVFKTVADPYVGKLSYFRVFSGRVTSDSHVLNTSKGQDERVGQLYVMRGKEQIGVSEIVAGDIGAVAKLQVTGTGDTLSDAQRRFTLPGITFPHPAFSAAVSPKTKSDLDKMGTAIQRLIEEDPTLQVSRDSRTGETIISGLGESHVQIALDRMARKFGVNVELGLPQVAYRETISVPVRGVEYKHKKQTGGHGQYGHVFLDLEPLPDADFEFAEQIVGGVVPKQFIPAVEKGVREAMEEGLLAGYPMVNIKVTLTDGSYHSVDSSEMAFKIAASQAFKKAAQQAKPILLEPIMHLRVTVPESYMGDVMSDLNGKRAQLQGMTPGENGMTTIEAMVPAAEIQRYATDLRSITQGRGSFTVEFSHYQPVPPHLTEQIVAAAKARVEAHA